MPDVVVLTNVTLEKAKWLQIVVIADVFLNVDVYLDGTKFSSCYLFGATTSI